MCSKISTLYESINTFLNNYIYNMSRKIYIKQNTVLGGGGCNGGGVGGENWGRGRRCDTPIVFHNQARHELIG